MDIPDVTTPSGAFDYLILLILLVALALGLYVAVFYLQLL